MARFHDSSGKLLGGFHAANHSHQTPEAAAVAATPPHAPPQLLTNRLNRRYGAEETVPDLHCSFGTFAYASAPYSSVGTLEDIEIADRNFAQVVAQQRGCQNPIETPDERHHCDVCGGDYCTIHAVPAAHDCTQVIQPKR